MSAPYHQRHNANLPWGHWLRAEGERLIDEHGRAWNSVRECLWQGRLGMAGSVVQTIDSQLEFLLATLVALDRRVIATEEQVRDLHAGCWHLQGHYALWLEGAGLIGAPSVGGLTPEGRAILVMLASTRSPESAPLPIGLATLTPMTGLDRGATRQEREQVLASYEAFARTLPYRFVREPIGGKPGIKLLGVQLGRNIPLTRVLWAQALPDDHARDRLFAWLADRIDRWQDWGDLAHCKGSQALSEHLLQLAFADRPALEGDEG